jgi:hypothetical protein
VRIAGAQTVSQVAIVLEAQRGLQDREG